MGYSPGGKPAWGIKTKANLMKIQLPPHIAKSRPRVAFEKRRSCFLDRRSGEDTRTVYSLDYFFAGGPERRRGRDRRTRGERRVRWYKNGMPCATAH